MPEISTSMTSPGFIHRGGLRAAPTPPVVPVAITSPGASSVNVEQYAMISGISNRRSAMVVRWTSTPLVQARHQRLLADILDFVGRHDPRAKATGADEILARRELVRVPLPIAHGAVIVTTIAEHVIEGLVAAK